MTILSLVSSPIFTSDKKKLRLSFTAFYWRVFRRPSWSSCNSSFFFTSHKRTTYNAMQRLGENTSCLWSWECSADRLHSWQLNVWGKHPKKHPTSCLWSWDGTEENSRNLDRRNLDYQPQKTHSTRKSVGLLEVEINFCLFVSGLNVPNRNAKYKGSLQFLVRHPSIQHPQKKI